MALNQSDLNQGPTNAEDLSNHLKKKLMGGKGGQENANHHN